MLSLILRRIFCLSLGKKIFFYPEALETICKRQLRFLKIFDVLGTLKMIKKLNSLRACFDLYTHAEHTGQELMRTLSVRVRN
jgi:hypothetical protein